MRPSTSRSALSTQISTRGSDWARASSTASSTTSSTASIVRRARPGSSRPDAAERRRRPGSASPARRSRRTRAACRPGARRSGRSVPVEAGAPRRLPRPDGVAEAVDERGLLARARPAASTSSGRVRGSRRLDARRGTGTAPAEALPQVRVQAALELGGDVVGRADDEVVEAAAPGTRRTRRCAAWRRCWCGQPSTWCWTLVLRDRPVVVVVTGQLVEPLRALDQLAELEHEHAGPLPVGQQHAEALVLVEHAPRAGARPACG